jgi:hypothetical protein
MFIFLMRARAVIESFESRLAVGFALVTAETASAAEEGKRAEGPVAARVDRCVLLTVPSPSAPSLPLQPALR